MVIRSDSDDVSRCPELTEGTRRCLAALRRDLPELLAKHRGMYVCYHLEQQIGINKYDLPLMKECIRRGIPDDEWIVQRIKPGAGDEVIEI